MACSNGKNWFKKDKVETIHGSFTVQFEDLGPPPLDNYSRFKNLEEWLSFIIVNEKPTKAIETYNFNVFEGQNKYTLCLTGVNKYDITNNHQQVRIDYSPTEKYFSLPENMHKGLTPEQVAKNLALQFQTFMKSDQFQKSFFTKAKSITNGRNGEIWPNK